MSKTTLPLSVFIIAYNEADRLPYTLKSLEDLGAAEVVLVDSGSMDDTVKLARDSGARVEHHPWEGYGPQKLFAQSLCTQPWLLNLDADEALSPALAEEIRTLFSNEEGPQMDGYRLAIRLVRRGEHHLRRWAPSNNPVRLYRSDKGAFKPSTVHDSVVMERGSQVGSCKAPILHRSFRSWEHAVEKVNRYSTMQAEDMLARGRRPAGWRVVVEPLAAFGKAYLMRRYFLLGIDGVSESVLYAFARTLRLAKAREAWSNQEQKDAG